MRHRLEKRVPPALVPLVRRASTTYAAVGPQTTFVQSFAILEVLHALLGWVRSPLGTTAAQVASRLYLVWGITTQFAEVRSLRSEAFALPTEIGSRLARTPCTPAWSSPGLSRRSCVTASTHARSSVLSPSCCSGCATPCSTCSTSLARGPRRVSSMPRCRLRRRRSPSSHPSGTVGFSHSPGRSRPRDGSRLCTTISGASCSCSGGHVSVRLPLAWQRRRADDRSACSALCSLHIHDETAEKGAWDWSRTDSRPEAEDALNTGFTIHSAAAIGLCEVCGYIWAPVLATKIHESRRHSFRRSTTTWLRRVFVVDAQRESDSVSWIVIYRVP